MRDSLFRLTLYAGCVSAVVVFMLTGGAEPIQRASEWVRAEMESASVFFVQSITIAQIHSEYRDANLWSPTSRQKVRILIVPGHEPSMGGTEFRGIRERDVVVDIADTLAHLLSQNPHYEVMVSRGKTAWNPILQEYFNTHAAEIQTFIDSQRAQMAAHLADGSISRNVNQMDHVGTTGSWAIRLYGVNKWASDHGYSIVLHLHVNDDGERASSRAGRYSGFAVYVPDAQYSNAEASLSIGEHIASRLNAFHATSTLPKERKGVIPDQELIAIGSNNSADNAALLIEYGYIYESQFHDGSVLPVAIADYAYQTYLGLQDFFGDAPVSRPDSAAYSYDWKTVTGKPNQKGAGVYALQSFLHQLGYYPPLGKSFSDCPVSGAAFECTRTAIMAYQSAHGLDATGAIGPQTSEVLLGDLRTAGIVE